MIAVCSCEMDKYQWSITNQLLISYCQPNMAYSIGHMLPIGNYDTWTGGKFQSYNSWSERLDGVSFQWEIDHFICSRETHREMTIMGGPILI